MNSVLNKPASKIGQLAAAAILALGLSGCATPPTDPEALKAYEEANDPLEPFNRAMFGLNNTIDTIAVKPTASAYDKVMPEFIKNMVTNFLTNLKQPVIAANSLLQGNPEAMGDSLGRFFFNTLAGAGGLFDPASGAGVPKHQEDFGQTLAVWGVEEGAYLVLPIFGPTTVRDGAGRLVDYAADPVNYWIRHNDRDSLVTARAGAEFMDFRARNLDEIDRLEETSIDFYATIRSIYRQQRRQLINNEELDLQDPELGTQGTDLSIDEDLYDDPASDESLSAADAPENAG
ncbi:MlaA family lipoprotein [Aestuariispira insulae]|uniref:Phospholipid-binding lipoprotein MlaA n=1 Tax=Aestuariispira insulae TaxID=1461337 RepID=A0A3D9HZ04_9PROT|nr:VacJ family lipoprotein [Aestuariispira insulae]RED54136.1 phospholipid-binding lipoprotein MlaA [Aestuariispira insulae]